MLPFDAKGCRYDQSTYTGRLRRFKEMTDPRMLLVGDEELATAQALLEKHARGQASSATDAELWEAKRIKDAIIHPVTNEKMFLPGRMSAFVPVNTIPTVGMPPSAPAPSAAACTATADATWRGVRPRRSGKQTSAP